MPKDLGFQKIADQTPTTAAPVGIDPPVSRWQRVELGDQVIRVAAQHRQPVPADPTRVYRGDILKLQELIGRDLSPWLKGDGENVSAGS